MRVGILGCGAISEVYLTNLCTKLKNITVTACADTFAQKARETAVRWGLAAMTPDELIRSSQVDCILLLTPPPTHYRLGMEALSNGKHLYTEKPMALTAAEGRALVEEARRLGLRIGCAPDTFLGAGIQTLLAAIESRSIGRPLAASAFMLCAGHELWHPNPAFYYQPGGGPILDMGPYALTVLSKVFGPAAEVFAMGMRGKTERTIATGPRRGERFPVNVDSFLSAQLRYTSGAVATLIYSFDTAPTTLPHLEIYGETGTLLAPDPNFFGGQVRLGRPGENAWTELPLLQGCPTDNMRGMGLDDMALAIREGRSHRADAWTGLQVVAIMEAILRSAEDGKPHQI